MNNTKKRMNRASKRHEKQVWKKEAYKEIVLIEEEKESEKLLEKEK